MALTVIFINVYFLPSATKPTLWITMGILLYLPEQSVHEFFNKVSALSAPGSLFTADIVCDLNDSVPTAREMKKILIENGTPPLFTTDDPEGKTIFLFDKLTFFVALFAKHGFGKTVNYLNVVDYCNSLNAKFSDADTDVGMQKSLSSLIVVQK